MEMTQNASSTPMLQSSDCQTLHWPAHKAFCQMNAELRCTTSPAGETIWRDLTVYIRTFHDPFATAMLSSYNLPVRAFAHLQEIFIVHLRYALNAEKPSERFKIWKLSKATFSELFARYAGDDWAEVITQEDERMLKEAQRVLGNNFGGMGHVCYIVEAGKRWKQVIRINPVAFDKVVAAEAPRRMWELALIRSAGNLEDQEVRELLARNDWRI